MIQAQPSQIGRTPFIATSGEIRRTPQSEELFGPCIEGPLDGLSSGTHVAATIAGGTSDIGISAGARLASASALSSTAQTLTAMIAPAANGSFTSESVISNSWGSSPTSSSLMRAFAKTADSLGHQVGPEGYILAK